MNAIEKKMEAAMRDLESCRYTYAQASESVRKQAEKVITDLLTLLDKEAILPLDSPVETESGEKIVDLQLLGGRIRPGYVARRTDSCALSDNVLAELARSAYKTMCRNYGREYEIREAARMRYDPDSFISGARWADRTIIDKVCGWLREQKEIIGVSFQDDFIARLRDEVRNYNGQ